MKKRTMLASTEQTANIMISDFGKYVAINVFCFWAEILTRVNWAAAESKNKCIIITADNYLSCLTNVNDNDTIEFSEETYNFYNDILNRWGY